jgi:hypothetical protein
MEMLVADGHQLVATVTGPAGRVKHGHRAWETKLYSGDGVERWQQQEATTTGDKMSLSLSPFQPVWPFYLSYAALQGGTG